MIQWYNEWYNDTMVQCYNGTTIQWYNDTMVWQLLNMVGAGKKHLKKDISCFLACSLWSVSSGPLSYLSNTDGNYVSLGREFFEEFCLCFLLERFDGVFDFSLLPLHSWGASVSDNSLLKTVSFFSCLTKVLCNTSSFRYVFNVSLVAILLRAVVA